jgi:hypothetical protein
MRSICEIDNITATSTDAIELMDIIGVGNECIIAVFGELFAPDMY